MVLERVQNRVLLALERLTGLYTGPSLAIEFRSLGFGRGIECVWKWPQDVVDVGLIGLRGNSVCLSLLCSSQLHYETGILRMFQESASHVTVDELHVTLDEVYNDIMVDQMKFSFLPGGVLIWEYKLALSRPRELKWNLVQAERASNG